MKLLTIKNAKRFVVLVACVLMCTYSFAGDPGDGSVGSENPDTAVPLDGGVALLIAAGIAYGAKKGHDAKRNALYDATNDEGSHLDQ